MMSEMMQVLVTGWLINLIVLIGHVTPSSHYDKPRLWESQTLAFIIAVAMLPFALVLLWLIKVYNE